MVEVEYAWAREFNIFRSVERMSSMESRLTTLNKRKKIREICVERRHEVGEEVLPCYVRDECKREDREVKGVLVRAKRREK